MAKAEINTNRDMNTLFLGFMTVLATILVVFTILMVDGFYTYSVNERVREVQVEVPNRLLTEQQKEAEEQLTGYRWVNRDEGLVAIPIDRAIREVAEQH